MADVMVDFFNFSLMLNACKFQEYLGNSRKFISQNEEFKLLSAAKVCGQNLTKSAKFEALLTWSSHVVFIYG